MGEAVTSRGESRRGPERPTYLWATHPALFLRLWDRFLGLLAIVS